MTDDCGQVGPVVTQTTIAIPSGALSTLSLLSYSTGEIWDPPKPAGLDAVAAPLKVGDLACPTFGLGVSTSSFISGTPRIFTTIGPPFNPIIVPPTQLFSLASEWWSSCEYFYNPYLLGVYDPPYALTPEAVLSPSIASTSTPPQVPASEKSDADPPISIKPTPASTQIIPFASRTDDAPSISSESTPNEPSQLQPVNGPLKSTVVSLTHPSSPTPSASQQDPSSAPSSIAATNTGDPPPSPTGITFSTFQNIGAIIYSAFGCSLAGSAASTVTIPSSGPTLIIVGGEDVSIMNPSAIVVERTTYTAGGDAATVSGEVISVAATARAATLSPSILAIGSQTFTVAPSALVFASTTILPGSAGFTISGTPISLELSGILILGSSTITLDDDPDPTSGPEVFIVGTQILTAGPSDLVVDGTTLTADGAGITISGTPVTLEPSGVFVVGTATITLGPEIGTNIPAKNATISPFTGSALKPGVLKWWKIVVILIMGGLGCWVLY